MAFEAYLYIEGVQGSSTSKVGKAPPSPHTPPAGAGPIEIQSYGLGIEMPMVENRSGTGAITVGRANFEDFETTKNLDVSTNALLYYCLSGKHINKAMILVFRSAGEEDGGQSKPTLYMKMEYQSIVLTEVSVSGSGDELPTETLKFNYGYVKYTYFTTNKKTGAADGGSKFFDWDRTENSGDKDG